MAADIVIRPIRPDELDAAKWVILVVAAPMFARDETTQEFIDRWWDLMPDVNDHARVYGPPRGVFLAALDGDKVIGTGALRPLDDETAELKRLYVLEEYQGRRIGYGLTMTLLDFARGAGYRRIRLSNDGEAQSAAVCFYERLGFRHIPRYSDSDDTVFMGLELSERSDADG